LKKKVTVKGLLIVLVLAVAGYLGIDMTGVLEKLDLQEDTTTEEVVDSL